MSQFPEEPLSSSPGQGFGYFPASPNQTLKNGHYKIIRKLGWGPRSSVWLATDPSASGAVDYCVIKILTVHATNEHKARGSQEIKALEAVKPRASFDHLPLLSDSFTEHSHHGNHLCIVTLDILPDIDSTFRLSAPDKSLRVHIVKKVIASIAESLYNLHQRNFIHGAVKPSNFSFAVSTIPEFLEPRLSKLPPVELLTPVAVDGVEYPVVATQPVLHSNSWDDDRSSAADYNVYLNNFGHVRRVGKNAKRDVKGQDSSLQPPEAVLQISFDQKADVWMLGCATYLLLTGEVLFSEQLDGASHLARISALTGQTFNSSVWKESSRYDEFFLPSGELRSSITETSLEEKLLTLGRVSEKDIKPAAAFIRDCLKVDPAERPSASDLMDHIWLASGYECSCGFCMR